MSTDDLMLFIAFLFALLVAAGFLLIFVVLRGRTRLREMAFKERLALIEKGLVPSPEVDPERFDALLAHKGTGAGNLKGSRYTTAGVLLMGVGGGMLLLLGFAAGVPQVGFGIGGGIAVIGLAALVNGLLFTSGE